MKSEPKKKTAAKKPAKGGLAAIAAEVKAGEPTGGSTAAAAELKAAGKPKKPAKVKAPKLPSQRELIIRSLLNGGTVADVGAELAEKNKWPVEKAKSFVGSYMSNIRQFHTLFAEFGMEKVAAIAAK